MTPTHKGGGMRPHGGVSAGMREASNAVAHVVDIVLKKVSVCTPPVMELDLHVPEKKSLLAEECSNCGRCLAKLCASLPFEVDLSWSVFADSLRKVSGCKDLKNILLLVAPMQLPNKEPVGLKVHCYRLDSRRHLGVSTVTQKDWRLIEGYHRQDSFKIVHCTRHIEPEDAATNTPIRGQVFKVAREASKAVSSTWYKGYPVRLSYKGCGTKSKMEVPQACGIPSLRQPKIPMRMQRLSSGNRQKLTQGGKRNGRKPKPSKAREPTQARTIDTRQLFEQMHQLSLGVQELQQRLLEAEENSSDRFDFFEYAHIFGRPLGPRSPVQDPPVLPVSFSNAAFCFLEEKLRWPSACEAFVKLRRLVGQINERQHPRLVHLLCFFSIAEDMQFKLYIRRMMDFPGKPPSQGRRYMIDCFVFDDRREYIASIALLDTQLHALARVFPGARQNFRFVDDAFQLISSGRVTKWLEAAMDAFNGRRWYKYLGQLALNRVGPRMAVLDLPEDGERYYEF